MSTETKIPNPIEVQGAAHAAYAQIAGETSRQADDVHRLSVCYRAADIMLQNLGSVGYAPTHEIHTIPGVPEHSYISLTTGNDEVIADPTWQQFLPPQSRTTGLPKVLMGSRGQVIEQAQAFGVPDDLLGLWRRDERMMTPAAQKARDAAVAEAADRAADAGKWEMFMQEPARRGRVVSFMGGSGRHRSR